MHPNTKPNIKKLPNLISRVPFLNIPDTPIVSTSQDFIPIADIEEGLILLKDGSVSLILESTSLNFGLLSEREQESVIVSYAALINSLSFSIQIVVRTLRKDISSYITYLDLARKDIKNPKLLNLMDNYKKFITETVKKRNVLGKRFFVIITFSPLELGVSKSVKAAANTRGPVPFAKDYVVKKAKIALYPRRDHIIRQANRLGLKLIQLNNDQIIELLYDVFNPQAPAIATENQEEGIPK